MALALAELEKAGCHVEHAQNLYRALAAIASTRPDVILVDMDELDPKEFAFFDEVRGLAPDAFCLLAFSPMCRERAVKAMEKAGDAYVLKPVYVNEVCTIVQRRLDQTRGETSADERSRMESLAQLAKGVAHEINNPLTTVSGWIQMLQSETPESDPKHKTFKLMDEETRRIAKVVGGLQAFAEQRPARRSPVPAAELVRAVIDEFTSGHQDSAVVLDPPIDDGLPTIQVDRQQMQQALVSLLDTAANGAGAEAPLEIGVSPNAGEALEIRVRSRRQFIQDPHVDGLFEPFYVSEGRSMGMGLAIARGIVHNHGGRLSVTCSRQDGTEFLASIPVAAGL